MIHDWMIPRFLHQFSTFHFPCCLFLFLQPFSQYTRSNARPNYTPGQNDGSPYDFHRYVFPRDQWNLSVVLKNEINSKRYISLQGRRKKKKKNFYDDKSNFNRGRMIRQLARNIENKFYFPQNNSYFYLNIAKIDSFYFS